MNAAQPATGGPTQGGLPPSGTARGQQPPQKPRRRVLTSLGFQIFIYFGGWWDVAYYIINAIVFIYKGLQLPYPGRNYVMEACFSGLWFLIEIPRLFLASKGNKTEHAGPIIFSCILSLPLLGMYIYFIAFQTYVLRIDQLLNGIAIAFMALQVTFAILTTVRFILATRFA